VTEKPTHYRVVTYSMYTADLDELERKISLLKQHGWRRANRSHLVRIALARLSDDDLVAIAKQHTGRST
jgi:hypothetical protein